VREVLDPVPWGIEPQDVIKHARLGGRENVDQEKIRRLVEKARSVARPRVLFREACVSECDEDKVEIDGVVFTSRLLKKNLEGVKKVFPYLATCGRELDQLKPSDGDPAETFLFDAVKELAVLSAHNFLGEYLRQRYGLFKKAHMNPGSLADWPISQQPLLFSLLGDVEESTGVRLTAENLMVPMMSISGIFFPARERFESCMLCQRGNCRRRRAAYDPEMVARYGI